MEVPHHPGGHIVKFAGTSDWRDAIPFDSPVIVATVVPGDPARCSGCGADAPLRPRTELWALKQHHPHHHDGYVRFFCREHLPAVRSSAPPAEIRRERTAARAERAPSTRRSPVVDEKPRALCPNCFIEVPGSGICGVCGEKVA
jgi:hypothetical protein